MATRSRTRPIRGVNLGNWLVLERWMGAGEGGSPFAGEDAADEYELRRCLPPEELAARLERHRRSFVTADTFAWLAERGVTLVRVPVPFFLFGDKTHESCVEHLDRALDWGAEWGIDVLIDLHTVPGGQNGFDNGGICGLCTWHRSPDRILRTLEVLERIARRYAGCPSLFGIEPLNEPASERVFASSMRRYGAGHPERVAASAPIPRALLAQFYRLVVERLSPILGHEAALVLHDRFQLEAWDRFLPRDRHPNIWLDTHLYVGTTARALGVRGLRGHLALARLCGLRVARAERHHPVLVGEWSLAHNLGTLDGPWRDEALRSFATAQRAAFERGAGSCFWSLRTPTRDEWSFEAAWRHGWLDLREAPRSGATHA